MGSPSPPRPVVRFTIGHLMVATAAAAALTALPPVLSLILIVLAIPCLSVPVAWWLVSRQERRLAGFGFWSLAALTNLVVVIECIAPDDDSLALSFVVSLFIAIPTIAALGSAWAALMVRDDTVRRADRHAAGYWVLLMGALPLLTLATLWPLHVAFFFVEPGLNRLADQVAAGKPVGYPHRVGPYLIESSAIAPISGYVGLLTDSPRGPFQPFARTGFVRLPPDPKPNTHGPILGINFDVYLGGGWWYRG
jgi:hypothetical protein